MFYYWAGARLPKPVGDGLLRNGAIVRVMSVSMAKTRNADLRRFIHDQHDTYFSRFADRDVLHDAFLASVSHDVREFAPRIAQPTLLVAAQSATTSPRSRRSVTWPRSSRMPNSSRSPTSGT